MYQLRRRQLSQNFLYNRKLIRKLVGRSGISQKDIVLEIGPGKGFITTELLKVAGRVIAVELDPKLVLHLKRYFAGHPRLTLISGNFLDFPLPKEDYKVFANIPFSIEGEIVRKLLDDPNPPQDCYLVVNKELAERLSGFPHENQFSLRHKPWFEFEIVHRFARVDFRPIPRVNAVLWHIRRREKPLLPVEKREEYEQFIEAAMGNGEPLWFNFDRRYGRKLSREILSRAGLSPRTKPSYLPLQKWLQLYNYDSLNNRNRGVRK